MWHETEDSSSAQQNQWSATRLDATDNERKQLPSGSSKRPRKRAYPSVGSETGGETSCQIETADDVAGRLSVDEGALKCPVCLSIFDEPYVTACGHTFCHACIVRSLEQYKSRCPQCQKELPLGMQEVFPNHALLAVLQRSRATRVEQKRIHKQLNTVTNQSASIKTTVASSFAEILSDPKLDLPTVSHLSKLLDRRRGEIQVQNGHLKTALLQDFLKEMVDRRNQKMVQLDSELSVLKSDQESTMEKLNDSDQVQHQAVPETCSSYGDGGMTDLRLGAPSVTDHSSVTSIGSTSTVNPASIVTSDALTASPSNRRFATTLIRNRSRMVAHFDDLERLYLERRIKETCGIDASTKCAAQKKGELDLFGDVLTKVTQFNSFRPLASLNYNVDISTTLSIVSSIEFDRDTEYFSVAGVTKKIKIYEYDAVLEDRVDIHYPISEMQCSSKISGVCWNPYTKSMLASSDYDGVVQLWDAWTSTATRKYQEHEKRCWTVHFSPIDPYLMATGSDDSRVKIWSVNCERSVATLDARVNVCCVHFSPTSRHQLAFGSADHGVHVYDLRNTRRALTVLKGHKKAVAYVRYCNSSEVVSASTDSSLRLWGNVDEGETIAGCLRVMKGHRNEKNFVGLATDGDYIVCGSETNRLYVYYKELTEPLMCYDFGAQQGGGGDGPFGQMTSNMMSGGGTARRTTASNGDTNDFVSAICWKKNSNVIIAANSQGMTQVLELV